MVKPPRIRHSKSRDEAVTIELEADQVKPAHDMSGHLDDPAGGPGHEKPDAGAEAAGSAESPDREGNDAANAQDSRSAGKASHSAGGLVLAGLVGGMIALAGAAALEWSGNWPHAPATRSNASALDALQASLLALGRDVETLRQEEAGAAGEGLDQALARLDTLEESLGRLEAVERALNGLRAEMEALPQSTGTEGNPELQQLLTRLEAIEGRGDEPAGDSQQVTALEDRIAALEATRQAERDEAAAQTLRVEGLEATVSGLSEQLSEQAARPDMMIAVTAAALRSAIDSGRPFAAELEAYAAVAPDLPQIDTLRDLSPTGIASHATIAAEMEEAAHRMLAATRPTDPEAGLLDQLWSSARSLVQIRPVGEVAGDGPAAIVARLETAVKERDYQRAREEFEKLPQAAQAEGRQVMTWIRGRMVADQIVSEALSHALKTVPDEG